MPTFTVHQPPLRKRETAPNPERFAFVRDGFHFWAFLLTPLWFLVHRLWLVLVLYLIASAALGVGLHVLHASGGLQMAVGALFAMLIGFEAATLWRWTLTRRGWKALGFVVAEDVELAEQRFFADWVKRTAEPAPAALNEPAPPAEPLFTAPVRRGAPSGNDVIGLFPEPGSQT